MFGVGFIRTDPYENARPDDYGMEMFWRLQLTENIQITPDTQLYFDPSRNPTGDVRLACESGSILSRDSYSTTRSTPWASGGGHDVRARAEGSTVCLAQPAGPAGWARQTSGPSASQVHPSRPPRSEDRRTHDHSHGKEVNRHASDSIGRRKVAGVIEYKS